MYKLSLIPSQVSGVQRIGDSRGDCLIGYPLTKF